MEIRNIFKITRKTFFNPAGWLGYESLKEQHQVLKSTFKDVFSVEKPTREETFDEAMQRLDLTPEEINAQMISYRRYAYFFLVIGFLVFFYAFHLLFRLKSLVPWLLGLGVSAILFSQAFKYHFWAFQIEQRKLGLTFNDWKKHLLGDKSHSA